MISLYELKPRFQTRLRPACRWLARRGVTANQLTLAAVALSVVTGGLLAWWSHQPGSLLVLPAVLFLRMALNALDGLLAREHGQSSRLGAILNEIGDVVSDAALYLPLALQTGVSAPLIVATVIAGIIVEMAGVTAVMTGSDRRYDGPLGKSDRALLFGTLGLLLGTGLSPGPWLHGLLLMALLLSAVTLNNRVRGALGPIPS